LFFKAAEDIKKYLDNIFRYVYKLLMKDSLNLKLWWMIKKQKLPKEDSI